MNQDTHVEKKYMDTKVGGEDGTDREIRVDIYEPLILRVKPMRTYCISRETLLSVL